MRVRHGVSIKSMATALFTPPFQQNRTFYYIIMLLLNNKSYFYDNSEISESNNSATTLPYRGLSFESEKGSYCSTLSGGIARKIYKVEWSVIFYTPDT